MRTYSFLPAVLLLGSMGCVAQPDPSPEPETRATTEDIEPTIAPRTSIFSCSASTNCAAPFNGVAKSCTGTQNCSGFADHVVCGSTTVMCTSTSSCQVTCVVNSQCDNLCGTGGGMCSSRCCLCF